MEHSRSKPIAGQVATELQNLYEANRVPESWGTPEMSRFVFDELSTHGFMAAGRELSTRLEGVGPPGFSRSEKLIGLAAGITLVVVANAFIKEDRPPVTQAGKREFSASTPAQLAGMYALGATLLFAFCEGNDSGGSATVGQLEEYVDTSRAAVEETIHGWDRDMSAANRFYDAETIRDMINAARIDGSDPDAMLKDIMNATGITDLGELAREYGEQDVYDMEDED